MELNDILTKVLPLDLVAINQARQRQAQLFNILLEMDKYRSK